MRSLISSVRRVGFGALTRVRKVRRAEDLLRLGLIYGPGHHSLRATAAMAAEGDIVSLSDKGVLRRLRKLGDDEPVSRENRRNAARIDAERPHLQKRPRCRSCDCEETVVTVTSSSGFTLRKVFYTVPSRLIGHRLRVRLHDDRMELLVGGTPLRTLSRGRAPANGHHNTWSTSGT